MVPRVLHVAKCPKCDSRSIRRSPTRSRWERLRKDITGKRPYRCRECQWRGWLPIGLGDSEELGSSRSTAPDPPNLKGSMLARPNPRLQFDVKTLDTFHTPPPKKDDA